MDALVINTITQDFISRKITQQKIKKNIIGRKRGPAKTIFGQKSGPAMAGPAVPPTTALETKAQLMIICTVADQGLFVSLHVYKTHYPNMHDFFFFCSNIDCGHTLEPPQ